MANGLYDAGRNAFLTGDIDWVADDVRVILVDTADYTANLGADDFLDDVPAAARVAVGALANKSASAGTADADNVVLSAVTGDESEALVLYQHTGTDSTSRLIAYIDDAAGLPVLPNGGDIEIVWDDGADRIFTL